MRVYLIYNRTSRVLQEIVLDSKETAQAYIDAFGNPTWEIVETWPRDMNWIERAKND